MKNFDPLDDFKKQVGMYFDQALDPKSQDEFLEKVKTDPIYLQAFQHEQNIRDTIKKMVRRPVDSSQLIQAIKNQIRKH